MTTCAPAPGRVLVAADPADPGGTADELLGDLGERGSAAWCRGGVLSVVSGKVKIGRSYGPEGWSG